MSDPSREIRVNLSGPNSGGGSYLALRDGRVHFEAYGDEAYGTSPASYTHDEALALYATHPSVQQLRDAIARVTAG